MPIVDIQMPDIAAPINTPKGFVVTPGADDVNFGSDAPTPPASSVWAAAFRQDNTVGAMLSAQDRDSPTYQEPGFNPWDAIKGSKYEPHWKAFAEVRNGRAADARKRQIDQEIEDRRTIEAAPWYVSLPAQIAAGAIDLPSLLPGGAFVRGVHGGYAVGRTAFNTAMMAGVSSAAQEAALQSIESTRPGAESATNIGASVLLGGLLGAGGAKLLSRAEWNRAVADLDRAMAPRTDDNVGAVAVPDAPLGASAGAAAVEPGDLAGNTIAGRAAGVMAAATRRLNPLLRGLQSESAATRDIITQLVENPIYLNKNMVGNTGGAATETLMKEWNAGLARAITATDEAWAESRRAGGQLGRDEFRQAVGRAMRRSDQDADTHVDKVAKAWRAEVFDPLKDAAIKAGLLPEDVTVETAASYLSRMWNRNALIAKEGQFKQIVSRWIEGQWDTWERSFDAETAKKAAKLEGEKLSKYLSERETAREQQFSVSPGQAGADVASEVFNRLIGRSDGGVRPEFVTVQARGPLKERTFNIPDHLVEEFLEHDVEQIGRRYSRVMSADVELKNKFGSVDLKDQIAKIRADYDRLRSGVSDEKTLTRLAAAEKSDVEDLEALRDLLRGTRSESPIEQNYGRMVRVLNHLNYIRSMGEVALASLVESVRPAMVHGLAPYIGTLGRLASNLDGIKASVKEAQLAGNVSERVLGTRLATLSEIADPYASRGPVEAFLENMTNVASKWNGIRMLTDMQKSIAAVMTQDRILGNVEKFSSVKGKEKSYLAYLGIDESMAGRIAEQFGKHGDTVDGVKVANTEKWTDDVARRAYRAAINKDIDSIITTKGVADVPLFANTATGKAMLQFKTFFLASHQRVLIRGLQEDQARFVSGILAMTAIGMMATYLKGLSGNRDGKTPDMAANPGWWISEGLDKSGVFSVPMELANTFEKATGFNPVKSPIKAFDEGARISQRNQNKNMIGTLVGPTAGFVDDVASVAGIPKRMIGGEEVTQAQKNAAERLLPFNSYAGMRQILRYVVNPQD